MWIDSIIMPSLRHSLFGYTICEVFAGGEREVSAVFQNTDFIQGDKESVEW